jgi:hypothetical protein
VDSIGRSVLSDRAWVTASGFLILVPRQVAVSNVTGCTARARSWQTFLKSLTYYGASKF